MAKESEILCRFPSFAMLTKIFEKHPGNRPNSERTDTEEILH